MLRQHRTKSAVLRSAAGRAAWWLIPQISDSTVLRTSYFPPSASYPLSAQGDESRRAIFSLESYLCGALHSTDSGSQACQDVDMAQYLMRIRLLRPVFVSLIITTTILFLQGPKQSSLRICISSTPRSTRVTRRAFPLSPLRDSGLIVHGLRRVQAFFFFLETDLNFLASSSPPQPPLPGANVWRQLCQPLFSLVRCPAGQRHLLRSPSVLCSRASSSLRGSRQPVARAGAQIDLVLIIRR